MSSGPGVDFCPYRTHIDWDNVQVADFSQVQYFQPSDSEEERLEEQGECFLSGSHWFVLTYTCKMKGSMVSR